MSRLARNPIVYADGIVCTFADKVLAIKGSNGEIQIKIPYFLDLDVSDKSMMISLNDPAGKKSRNFPMLGTIRAQIVSAIKGINNPFKKTLELSGTGYKSAIKGDILEMSLGYSHPIEVKVPPSLKVVCVKPTLIEVYGIKSEEVGKFVAEVVAYRKPIPYKGGEILPDGKGVIKKAGKR
ncbi:50S ribosomal protein L6 [Candidatus Cytomitobacter primus]|uniref:50S ribosomal protein L6 n=1 Tax=Candidatus Cytomitobacter primus TaxID=2066024 RepID=A0A5C0UF43_9PROT|nr:50S ribosomal protein L6 [Candidatus Cytomitobacter primus]QEK38726.1 50S ribosomal protein L6 [Candidatus Cytomitobacter primus]